MTATVCAGAMMIGPLPAVSAADGPWGPTHVLYGERSSGRISQATTSHGTTVAVFRRHPHRDKPSVAMVAIRPSGGEWSSPARLDETQRAVRPRVIAWGEAQLSIIWTSGRGHDNLRFSMRTLTADGTLGAAEKLIEAADASAKFRAAINSSGHVALAWSSGDRYDRVAVRDLDGTWREYPKVPIYHSGEVGLNIPEPRALYLDDGGGVSVITFGRIGSQQAIWRARAIPGGAWVVEPVQPTTRYIGVDKGAYASNARGDLVTVTEDVDDHGVWTSQLRFAAAGKQLGEPTTLTTYQCGDRRLFCAGATIADDGTVTVAYPRSAGDQDIVVEVLRRDPDGSFSTPQAVTNPYWENRFGGMQVMGNGAGNAVISFIAEAHSVSTALGGYPYGFNAVRCPAANPCVDRTYVTDDDPGGSDPWVMSMGPDAEVTVTWSNAEYGRDRGVSTRQLAAVG